jgi:hypothetical protein
MLQSIKGITATPVVFLNSMILSARRSLVFRKQSPRGAPDIGWTSLRTEVSLEAPLLNGATVFGWFW